MFAVKWSQVSDDRLQQPGKHLSSQAPAMPHLLTLGDTAQNMTWGRKTCTFSWFWKSQKLHHLLCELQFLPGWEKPTNGEEDGKHCQQCNLNKSEEEKTKRCKLSMKMQKPLASVLKVKLIIRCRIRKGCPPSPSSQTGERTRLLSFLFLQHGASSTS